MYLRYSSGSSTAKLRTNVLLLYVLLGVFALNHNNKFTPALRDYCALGRCLGAAYTSPGGGGACHGKSVVEIFTADSCCTLMCWY